MRRLPYPRGVYARTFTSVILYYFAFLSLSLSHGSVIYTLQALYTALMRFEFRKPKSSGGLLVAVGEYCSRRREREKGFFNYRTKRERERAIWNEITAYPPGFIACPRAASFYFGWSLSLSLPPAITAIRIFMFTNLRFFCSSSVLGIRCRWSCCCCCCCRVAASYILLRTPCAKGVSDTWLLWRYLVTLYFCFRFWKYFSIKCFIFVFYICVYSFPLGVRV